MFNIYVIESNGEYYYSLKGQDFRSAAEATIFRSEKAAKSQIRHAIKMHEEYVERTKERWPDLAEKAQALVERWKNTAKIVKIA
jgi:hypothetical protein